MRYENGCSGMGVALATLALGLLGLPSPAASQQSASSQSVTPPSAAAPLTRAQLDELRTTLRRHMNQERGRLAGLQRQVDVVTLYSRLADVAFVDEVRFFGPPVEEGEEPRAVSAFVFIPKSMDGGARGSLLIWERGDDALEIDSWSDVPELRELMARGVTVVAPTYDGAPEERLDAVPEYALQRYPFLDPSRVEWRAPR